MTEVDRVETVMNGFEEVAERLGDITAAVIDRYYRHFPEAKASFEKHGLGNRENLEGQMVENAVYFIMTWPEDPEQVKIALGASIPHHHDTLAVWPDWYIGLIDTVIALVLETIETKSEAVAQVWLDIREEFAREIEIARGSCFVTDERGPLPAFDCPALQG